MTGIVPFTSDRADVVRAIVRDRFNESSVCQVDKFLSNPVQGSVPLGDIAYENDNPVGFQAAILRRLYKDRHQFLGVNGGMLGMKKGASPVLLMSLMKATIAPRGGSQMFFANTANPISMKMNRLLGVKGKGSHSCETIRFACVYCPSFLKIILPRMKAERVLTIDTNAFDRFWEKYLSTNKGIVSSRSSEELTWMFGDRLLSGGCVMLVLKDRGEIVGYIVLRSNGSRRRWMIIDWIALDNDPEFLGELLRSALRYLRRETNALLVEAIGFPDFAQRVLKKWFPFRRKAPNNSFIWKSNCTDFCPDEHSWFFGPYDGDRAM